MQTHLDCIPCFLHQSLEAARMAVDDEILNEQVMKEVMKYLLTIDFSFSPPEISKEVHRIIKQVTGVNDPYITVKKKANEHAKNQIPILQKMIEDSDDALLMAAKLSIIGNVVDFGTINRFNVEEMIDNIAHKPFDHKGYAVFKKRLENASSILYLADNTGEVIFDFLLIEQLAKMKKNITYVVKSNPIINDATEDDALFAGIDRYATIMKGDDGQTFSSPGMVLKYGSDEFLDALDAADMVISKGQGNYESLSMVDREVFFLLMVKCPLVANDIGINVGTMVLKVKT